ncbi:hypothetical protein ACIPYR_20070 [Streptomyces parvus]|uniref:hypothetical protein n=1 Tax=Streptomyces parvus TaxID=66428 RepID=UPI0038275AC8
MDEPVRGEPDAENVVGGLDGAQRLEVEAIAQRIADAVGVRRIGKPFDITWYRALPMCCASTTWSATPEPGGGGDQPQGDTSGLS